MRKTTFTFILLILLVSCSNDNVLSNPEVIDEQTSQETNRPNILLLIADDFGLDACPNYDIGTIKPSIPNIEGLISNGIKFNNFWTNPVCSPTRASILTGKYGFRTDVLDVNDELSITEISIQEYISTNLKNEYSNAVIGKWHLSNNINHPNDLGVDYYAGSLSGGLTSYWDWKLVENGIRTTVNEYNTTKFTDLAINWVSQQTKPWFLWLAYNAPHTPFHLPPAELHSQGNLPNNETSIEANPLPYYLASVEAMDYEIGRLLNSLNTKEKENTIILFIGDNGTPNEVVQEYNSKRAKGSLFKGGINVPLIVSGKGVYRIGDKDDSLINATDLYATIANIAGIDINKINDSQNFSHLFSLSANHKRDFLYSEINNDITIRNSTHKYILKEDGTEYLYDLSSNPMEEKNLLHQNNLPLSDSNNTIKNELIERIAGLKK